MNTINLTCKKCLQISRINLDRAAKGIPQVLCGHCQKPFFLGQYEAIPGILPSHYQHPLDAKTRASLNKIPGINTILKIILKEGLVKYQNLLLRQNCVKVTSTHLKKYHDMLGNSARVLEIKKLPTLYLQQNPMVNAFTFGADDHVIVLTTALIDLLEEEEVETVIAHELGHIHCDHVLYKTAARILSTIAIEVAGRIFSMASSIIYPIIYSLLYWDRTSELSADRAELLINQNYEISVRTLLKIAGGSQKLNSQLNIEEFLSQANETEELTEKSLLEKIYHIIQQGQSTHHFPTWRAKFIYEWAHSENAFKLLAGELDVHQNKSAQNGKTPNDDGNEEIKFSDIVNEFKKIFKI
jgi:Zn-dependent protease with chaperone function